VLDEADKLLREEAQFREIRLVHEQASKVGFWQKQKQKEKYKLFKNVISLDQW
jgi:hypothetical protein